VVEPHALAGGAELVERSLVTMEGVLGAQLLLVGCHHGSTMGRRRGRRITRSRGCRPAQAIPAGHRDEQGALTFEIEGDRLETDFCK
jgi:hypothetical protein